MTAVDRPLVVNAAVTAAEVIDGEAVMINLSDGTYYTMDGVGSEVWLLIERGCSLEAIAGSLAARHGVEEARVLDEVGEVVDALLSAGLVIEGDATAAVVADVELLGPSPTYGKPELVTYSDMADVLALDPPLPMLEPTGEL